MRNKFKLVFMVLLTILTWFALCLQFYISTEKYLADGRTFGGAIVQLLSYYTIQVNGLIALCLAVLLLAPKSNLGRFFAKPSVIAAVVLYITIVFFVYQLVLRGQHVQLGLFRFTDESMHTAIPILFVLFWLIFRPAEKLKWNNAFTWLIYPLLYCFYILIRGAISHYYPYSFINGNKLSGMQIFINCVFLLFAFLGIGLIYIGITRLRKTD